MEAGLYVRDVVRRDAVLFIHDPPLWSVSVRVAIGFVVVLV